MAVSGKTVRYRRGNRVADFDADTMLWMGRMLVGEGWQNGKGEAVLWATMNRYMDAAKSFGSYQNLIRLFSQPINDRWLPGGDLFEKYKKSDKAVYKNATSDAAVSRRRRIRSLQWSDMPLGVQQIVGKFMIGQLPYPAKWQEKRYNNFASYEGVETGRPGGVWYGGEYFFEDLPSKGRIAIESAAGGGAAGGGAAGGGAAGGGAGGGLIVIAGIIALAIASSNA